MMRRYNLLSEVELAEEEKELLYQQMMEKMQSDSKGIDYKKMADDIESGAARIVGWDMDITPTEFVKRVREM